MRIQLLSGMCAPLFLRELILAMRLKFKNKTGGAARKVLPKKTEVKVFQDWGV